MLLRKTALERAFELAQSGRCRDLSDVINDLKSERFVTIHIKGATLKKQLQSLIDQAKHSR